MAEKSKSDHTRCTTLTTLLTKISWITPTCAPPRIYVHTDESLNPSLSYTAALLNDDLFTAA
ncbi:hypothetical protein [Amycolatopsis tolypomycina]|uniref:hypothetical protein n=1 Tax=Amycolatopsis tolypomycina TaxID=208445 RepID=UPI00339F981F